MQFPTTILFALVGLAVAVPASQQCALAHDSCHPDCETLRNNLNICLCNTASETAAEPCKDAQAAYTNCAIKKCVMPAQRRFEDVGDEPRWIVVGGDVVAADGGVEGKGKLTRRERECWKFLNRSVFCKDV